MMLLPEKANTAAGILAGIGLISQLFCLFQGIICLWTTAS